MDEYNIVLYDGEGNIVYQGNYTEVVTGEGEPLPSGFIDKPINDYTPTEAYLFGIFVTITIVIVVKIFSK